jgi:hypothetical protein
MSNRRTGVEQLLRLLDRGLDVAFTARYRDIDTIDDALLAAQVSPSARFARTLASACATA